MAKSLDRDVVNAYASGSYRLAKQIMRRHGHTADYGYAVGLVEDDSWAFARKWGLTRRRPSAWRPYVGKTSGNRNWLGFTKAALSHGLIAFVSSGTMPATAFTHHPYIRRKRTCFADFDANRRARTSFQSPIGPCCAECCFASRF